MDGVDDCEVESKHLHSLKSVNCPSSLLDTNTILRWPNLTLKSQTILYSYDLVLVTVLIQRNFLPDFRVK